VTVVASEMQSEFMLEADALPSSNACLVLKDKYGAIVSNPKVIARAKRMFLEDGNPEVAQLLRHRQLCQEKQKLQVLTSSGDVKKSALVKQYFVHRKSKKNLARLIPARRVSRYIEKPRMIKGQLPRRIAMPKRQPVKLVKYSLPQRTTKNTAPKKKSAKVKISKKRSVQTRKLATRAAARLTKKINKYNKLVKITHKRIVLIKKDIKRLKAVLTSSKLKTKVSNKTLRELKIKMKKLDKLQGRVKMMQKRIAHFKRKIVRHEMKARGWKPSKKLASSKTVQTYQQALRKDARMIKQKVSNIRKQLRKLKRTAAKRQGKIQRLSLVAAKVNTRVASLKDKMRAVRRGLKAGVFTALHGGQSRAGALKRLNKLSTKAKRQERKLAKLNTKIGKLRRKGASAAVSMNRRRARLQRRLQRLTKRSRFLKKQTKKWTAKLKRDVVLTRRAMKRARQADKKARIALKKQRRRLARMSKELKQIAKRIAKLKASKSMRTATAKKAMALQKKRAAVLAKAKALNTRIKKLMARIAKLKKGIKVGAFKAVGSSDEAAATLARLQARLRRVRGKQVSLRAFAKQLRQRARTMFKSITQSERAAIKEIKALYRRKAHLKKVSVRVRAGIVKLTSRLIKTKKVVRRTKKSAKKASKKAKKSSKNSSKQNGSQKRSSKKSRTVKRVNKRVARLTKRRASVRAALKKAKQSGNTKLVAKLKAKLARVALRLKAAKKLQKIVRRIASLKKQFRKADAQTRAVIQKKINRLIKAKKAVQLTARRIRAKQLRHSIVKLSKRIAQLKQQGKSKQVARLRARLQAKRLRLRYVNSAPGSKLRRQLKRKINGAKRISRKFGSKQSGKRSSVSKRSKKSTRSGRSRSLVKRVARLRRKLSHMASRMQMLSGSERAAMTRRIRRAAKKLNSLLKASKKSYGKKSYVKKFSGKKSKSLSCDSPRLNARQRQLCKGLKATRASMARHRSNIRKAQLRLKRARQALDDLKHDQ